jgi:ABC-type multidrug transport system fused ATPase/permease subunit
MFERMARGWALMKESWNVLRLDKELLMFPIFSSIACLLVMASFALPLIVSPTMREAVLARGRSEQQALQEPQNPDDNFGVRNNEEPQRFKFSPQQIVPVIVGFAFYLATSFVIVFFNTALVCCALIRFAGGNPTLRDGLRAAMERLPQILGWALLTATVGTILKQIEDRVPLAGKIVVSLIGMAWAVVTFMVVPILAAEKLGPFAAVKRSSGLLRKTWGEALVGQVSLGAIRFVFMLPVLLALLVAGFFWVATGLIWPLAIVGIVAVPFFIVLAIAFSTLQQIFLAAVYQYAAQGTVPTGFSRDLIELAFTPKDKE